MADILKKLAAVVFLTLLIWAWAYLELEEEMEQTGRLYISQAIRQDLFVNFEDRSAPVSLKLTIKGPPVQIAELKKRLRASDADPDKVRLEFFYDPETWDHSATGSHNLDVVEFLNKSDKLKDLAVTVVSCEPSVINVKVEKLTKKSLAIQCLDENNVPLYGATIEPPKIQMFVRDNWTGPATVILTEGDIAKSRKETVTKKPFIELAQGKQQLYKDTVSIKLPSTETLFAESPINLTLGYIFSKGMQGKYEVNLTNETLLRQVNVRGTAEAIKAYQDMEYQILIELHDDDKNATEAIHRPIRYNFPEEFVQKGEIELVGRKDDAIFKLVPVSESSN